MICLGGLLALVSFTHTNDSRGASVFQMGFPDPWLYFNKPVGTNGFTSGVNLATSSALLGALGLLALWALESAMGAEKRSKNQLPAPADSGRSAGVPPPP